MDHPLGTYDTLNARGTMRLILEATPLTAAANSWQAEKKGRPSPLLALLAAATGISTGEKSMAVKLFLSPLRDHVSSKKNINGEFNLCIITSAGFSFKISSLWFVLEYLYII